MRISDIAVNTYCVNNNGVVRKVIKINDENANATYQTFDPKNGQSMGVRVCSLKNLLNWTNHIADHNEISTFVLPAGNPYSDIINNPKMASSLNEIVRTAMEEAPDEMILAEMDRRGLWDKRIII